jgi:hypothetical protein
MSKDTSYNGWSNYATWRVNLEVFDSIPLEDFDNVVDKFTEDFDGNEIDHTCILDAWQIAPMLAERAEYYVELSSTPGLARDYALAFLSDVNYVEIAEHMIEEYKREVA